MDGKIISMNITFLILLSFFTAIFLYLGITATDNTSIIIFCILSSISIVGLLITLIYFIIKLHSYRKS